VPCDEPGKGPCGPANIIKVKPVKNAAARLPTTTNPASAHLANRTNITMLSVAKVERLAENADFHYSQETKPDYALSVSKLARTRGKNDVIL